MHSFIHKEIYVFLNCKHLRKRMKGWHMTTLAPNATHKVHVPLISGMIFIIFAHKQKFPRHCSACCLHMCIIFRLIIVRNTYGTSTWMTKQLKWFIPFLYRRTMNYCLPGSLLKFLKDENVIQNLHLRLTILQTFEAIMLTGEKLFWSWMEILW